MGGMSKEDKEMHDARAEVLKKEYATQFGFAFNKELKNEYMETGERLMK